MGCSACKACTLSLNCSFFSTLVHSYLMWVCLFSWKVYHASFLSSHGLQFTTYFHLASLFTCIGMVMQSCRCFQECNLGCGLHNDYHRFWLGGCIVYCPSVKIICQSKYGLPATAWKLWKKWRSPGKFLDPWHLQLKLEAMNQLSLL